MVSVRSATWAILLLQLVLSCAACVASVAVVAAQSQSRSARGAPLGPSPPMLLVCGLSFSLLASSVLAMFGLHGRRPFLLVPVICISTVVCTFHSLVLSRWLTDWWTSSSTGGRLLVDADWLITATGSAAFQCAFMAAIFLQVRCYRHLN